MNHFTGDAGFDAIRAQPTWRFLALQPPGDHAIGAYFTNLGPQTVNLAKRLGLPRRKLVFVFSFVDAGDLVPIPGGRGRYIFYSPSDYDVIPERQECCGETGL